MLTKQFFDPAAANTNVRIFKGGRIGEQNGDICFPSDCTSHQSLSSARRTIQ